MLATPVLQENTADLWPIDQQQFEADLHRLRENPSRDLMEMVLRRYIMPICISQWYEQFEWVDGDDAISVAYLDCWERLKSEHERRLDRYGKPLRGWDPARCRAFPFFLQVAKSRIRDFAKAEGRHMGRERKIYARELDRRAGTSPDLNFSRGTERMAECGRPLTSKHALRTIGKYFEHIEDPYAALQLVRELAPHNPRLMAWVERQEAWLEEREAREARKREREQGCQVA